MGYFIHTAFLNYPELHSVSSAVVTMSSNKIMSAYVYKKLHGNEGPYRTVDIILLNIKPRIFCAQLDVTLDTPGII
jgi:hypothetical protein